MNVKAAFSHQRHDFRSHTWPWPFCSTETFNSLYVDNPERVIWKNHIRNRRIAKLAKHLSAGDATLTTNFPSVANALPVDHPHRVIVLVDSLEHAVAIADRLPEWPVIAGDNINERHLTSQQRRVLTNRRNQWNTGATRIVTIAGSESVDISGGTMTVVIWASAGPHLPPLPPAWRVAPAGEDRELLIIDIDDGGNSKLTEWTHRRKKAYQQAEWLPPGTNPLVARIKRFLNNRPGRNSR